MHMKIEICQVSPSTSQRGHKVKIDRPAEKGGADAGLMGGELFLVSVGGCFMSNLLAAIRAREAQVEDVQTEVIGTLDNSPARFSRIELAVSANCEDRDLIQKLVEIADHGCIMMNTLRDKLDVKVRIAARV
jgi:putative redox protein